jgi:arylsulfatase A-like enzyme
MPLRTLCLTCAGMLLLGPALRAEAPEGPRPNILWLTSEDHGPHLGCYGDTYATTPNVDRLAAQGVIYTRCWSNAPVCAPARTTLISGMYATSTGGEHMRSLVSYPAGKQMFPQLLREAGYYCTNNVKEDYNLARPDKVWDESSNKAHWKNRKPGQPFFAVFNSVKSHESKIRTRPHKQLHDPARVRVPAYHPDTPEVRQDWAQYYDVVTEADADAGLRLKELEAAGLADDTIVFYFADHGSGMPRCKRWPYDSGLRVPLVVRFPAKFRHLAPADYRPGGKIDRLVSFVDFAPTVLSLAGVKPPEWMQGFAFLGKFASQPQPYVFGFRGRMDERYDLVRSVTDGRYVYVRNYLPHLIYGQHVEYMFQTPTTRVWKKLHDEGKLNAAQDRFWQPKPPEELYDLSKDPDEVRNLAGSPEHQEVQKKLRQAQQDLARKILDVGFLPEGERFTRAPGKSPYDMARTEGKYPFARIFLMAEVASLLRPDGLPILVKALNDEDSAVRYWAALGIRMRGEMACTQAAAELRKALSDRSPYVRIVAAEALGLFGTDDDLKRVLPLLVGLADPGKNDVFTAVAALTALEALGLRAKPVAAAIRALPEKGALPDQRYSSYVPRLLTDLKANLESR